MALFENFPYTNLHNLNLDWIISKINSFDEKLNHAMTAGIKVANPIQWDITTQYEEYTIVVDNNNAYLSVQPVPYGIAISNEDYWQKIFDLDVLFENFKRSIAFDDDGNSPTSSKARAYDSLVWLNDKLYRVKEAIALGDTYTTSNVEEISMEIWVREFVTAINNQFTPIQESIAGLALRMTTAEGAITAIQQDYSRLLDNKKVKIVAGAIRNDGTGWAFVNDDYHTPINVSSVEVTAQGHLKINYGFTAKKVISMYVGADETFAELYNIGASVGLTDSTFLVYNKPKTVAGYVYYSNATWNKLGDFTGISFASNTGLLTLTHEEMNSNYAWDCHVTGRGCFAQMDALTGTSLLMRFVNADGTVITTPTDNCKAYVSRTERTHILDTNNIVNSSGNFWFIGIVEID